MYGGVITDFKDLLTRYDAQMNSLGITPDDQPDRGFMSFGIEPTDKSRVLRRMMTALGVRQQIAMSIAEHDPDLAFAFYSESLLAISNPIEVMASVSMSSASACVRRITAPVARPSSPAATAATARPSTGSPL